MLFSEQARGRPGARGHHVGDPRASNQSIMVHWRIADWHQIDLKACRKENEKCSLLLINRVRKCEVRDAEWKHEKCCEITVLQAGNEMSVFVMLMLVWWINLRSCVKKG